MWPRYNNSRMNENYSGLNVVDYVILSTLLLISASIGIYYRFSGGKQRTTKEYLLADRNMSFIPVAFSLMASFMSSITLLGVSSENYIYGTQFVVINLAYIIGTPLAAYFYLPVFYKLQHASVYKVISLKVPMYSVQLKNNIIKKTIVSRASLWSCNTTGG